MFDKGFKFILIGIISLCSPVIALMLTLFIPWNSTLVQVIKGFLIGISFIVIMFFIGISVQEKEKIKCNTCLAVSSILGASYSIYIIISLIFLSTSLINVNTIIGGILSGILGYFLIPYIVMLITASVLMIIGALNKSYGFALAGSIVYTLTLNIPSLVLGYIGSSQIKNINTSDIDLEEC